ncbi:hypothetical protein [Nonlabens xiamenensis]|uniref:hypothetical protein n=1 Tax=Nonlabens xiamenensis TaxID=2341043 RepID=UPI000F60A573|nr:hypothetical protein [Nonlabens xiamenensis]
MKKWIAFLILPLFLACKEAKEFESTTAEETPADVKKAFDFPNDYLGVYKGDLEITTSNGVNSIPMEFHLLSTADSTRFDYKIFYGEERSERAYTLISTPNPNVFELDENNGIILPVAYADGTLFSTYQVAGNLLNSTEKFYPDHMDFMITMSSLQDSTTAGKAEGYKVDTYPISVIQQAYLKKNKDSL